MSNRRFLAVAILALTMTAPGCKKKEAGDAPADDKNTPADTEKPAAEPETAAKDEEPAPEKDEEPAEEANRMGAFAQFAVQDFDAWKAVFDGELETRKAAGIRGHHIHQDPDDKNRVSLYLGFSDLDAFNAWFTGDKLKETMKKAGVNGPPKVTLVKLVSDNVVDKGGAAIFVTHEVEDFDKWYEVYNAFDEARTKMGITGHAVARAVDNPNMVMVYHQADSVDTLKTFVASPELKEAMTNAGVKGPPEISFHTSTEPFITY